MTKVRGNSPPLDRKRDVFGPDTENYGGIFGAPPPLSPLFGGSGKGGHKALLESENSHIILLVFKVESFESLPFG